MKTTVTTVLALATLAISVNGKACETTINFDTFPGGLPVPDGTVITNQYAALGVLFSTPGASGPTAGVLGGEASSPPNALYGLYSTHGSTLPIVMSFAAPLPRRVSMTLISVGRGITTVTAFAADAITVLDAVSVTHGPNAGVGKGNHDPITLVGPAIATVKLEITQTGEPIDGVGIDDLAFLGKPTLSIAAAPNNAHVSWPNCFTNFVLEAVSSLGPVTSWETVTNAVDNINGVLSVTLPIDEVGRFFRLKEIQQ